ncbi:hypothetical protein D9613_006918 [Agrocybe pediades]|uniref:HIT-type domain-containing protein n=1 Tax=Agrocybe pediades TaxID=84607 RepID=A0A8H4QHC3_9AGAR|nr:hypothetical protein D9613_006918 [Agrocybe pediades]
MPTSDIVTLSSPVISSGQNDTVACNICRRQFAKYTCTRCNVRYCSLTCYRSQAHNQCSEAFYKKEIEEEIHAGPSKSLQEKRRMMEMLQKFEEETSQQSIDEDDGDDNGFSDLAERFGSVDLDALPPDKLWSMLNAEERKKFMRTFEDPTSELAQQLLASEELEQEIQTPWWEGPSTPDDGGGGPETNQTGKPEKQRHGQRPQIMSIPKSMVTPIPTGHPLVYNMCAICIAYAYTTRHLGTSPLGTLKHGSLEYKEAKRLFSQLVPFLTDRKSTHLYSNVPSVITSIWSLSEPGEMTSEMFALLLRDAATLMRPLNVVELAVESGDNVPSNHPHCMPVLVLSDIHELFSDVSETEGSQAQEGRAARTKQNHVTHKARFYAAHILSTPSAVLRAICDEMVARAGKYRAQEDLGTTRQPTEAPSSKKLVEEI